MIGDVRCLAELADGDFVHVCQLAKGHDGPHGSYTGCWTGTDLSTLVLGDDAQ